MPQCKELPKQAPGGVPYNSVRSQLGFLFIPAGEIRTMAVKWGGDTWTHSIGFIQWYMHS